MRRLRRSITRMLQARSHGRFLRGLRRGFGGSRPDHAGNLVGYSYRRLPMAAQEPVLEYLATTRIGEKGQLTVPKQFREDLRLATGAPFAVLRMGNGLLLIPEQQRIERLCDEIGGAFLAA